MAKLPWNDGFGVLPEPTFEREMMDTIDYLIRDLCEIPDRNSPDDQPEMLLVTAAEIRTAIERWIPAMPTTKDAERYRKLRDEENWGDDGADGGGSRWAVLGELTGAGFDAFVDALPETPND